jgi:5'-nucleotidase/UDP-sugar diphosphatase
MKRYLIVGAFAVATLTGGCSMFSKSPSATQVNPAVTDIAPTPPAPLYVPPSQPVQPVQQPVAIATPTDGGASATVASGAGGSYTVQRGDTLYKLAREHYGDGKQWTRITAANPGLSPQSLKIGQKIMIP